MAQAKEEYEAEQESAFNAYSYSAPPSPYSGQEVQMANMMKKNNEQVEKIEKLERENEMLQKL